MRRRIPTAHRRLLDQEAARIRRTDAVDAFAAAAADLAALRHHDVTDPIALTVAESRLETARKRFWAADADFQQQQAERAAAC